MEDLKKILNRQVIKEFIFRMGGYVVITGILVDLLNKIIFRVTDLKSRISLIPVEEYMGIYSNIMTISLENYGRIYNAMRGSWIYEYNIIEKLNVIIILIIVLYIVSYMLDEKEDIKYMNHRIERVRKNINELRILEKLNQNTYFTDRLSYFGAFDSSKNSKSSEASEDLESVTYMAKKIYEKGEINWKKGRKRERNIPTQESQLITLYIIILIIINISWLEILISILENEGILNYIYNFVLSMILLVLLAVYIVLKEGEREEIKKESVERENMLITIEIVLFNKLSKLRSPSGIEVNIVEEKGEIYIIKI